MLTCHSSYRPAFVREQGAKYQVLGEQRERNEKDEFVIASARVNQKKVIIYQYYQFMIQLL